MYFDRQWFIDGVICVRAAYIYIYVMVIFWSPLQVSHRLKTHTSCAIAMSCREHCLRARQNKCVPPERETARSRQDDGQVVTHTKGFDLFKSKCMQIIYSIRTILNENIRNHPITSNWQISIKWVDERLVLEEPKVSSFFLCGFVERYCCCLSYFVFYI